MAAMTSGNNRQWRPKISVSSKVHLAHKGSSRVFLRYGDDEGARNLKIDFSESINLYVESSDKERRRKGKLDDLQLIIYLL